MCIKWGITTSTDATIFVLFCLEDLIVVIEFDSNLIGTEDLSILVTIFLFLSLENLVCEDEWSDDDDLDEESEENNELESLEELDEESDDDEGLDFELVLDFDLILDFEIGFGEVVTISFFFLLFLLIRKTT